MSELMVPQLVPADWQELYEVAVSAREKAYAPYSCFRVGAAVRTQAGHIYTGSNIENGSFGLTVCAERVAAWKAVSDGEHELTQLAVVTEDGSFPCGACRQVLYEFTPELVILVADLDKRGIISTLAALLPNAFKIQR